MFGDKEQLSVLEKLQSARVPQTSFPPTHELHKIRASFDYLYVINWLYNFKGYLRLSSEYFDVELFEMELLNLLDPPPLDESVLFINKLKTQIINHLTNSASKFSASDFDMVIKRFFVNTPLGDADTATIFDTLKLSEKFEVLFVILNYLSSLANFRLFLDKTPDVDLSLNAHILKSSDTKNKREDYLLLFNSTKVYKRTIEYPELIVPKKRKDAPEDPEDFFWDQFDVDLAQVSFSVEAWTLDNFNQFIKTHKKNSTFKSLTTNAFQANVVSSEIKKRRIIMNRKKEYQMINLMATRKRSSRIEAKERQKQQDIEDIKAQKEREMRLAIELDKISKPLNYNSNVLSREERLKMRKLNTDYRKDSSQPKSVSPEAVKSETISLTPDIGEAKPNIEEKIEKIEEEIIGHKSTNGEEKPEPIN
ncbi:hypothetical protein PSN45_002110 [Yamadazyma tenuis]|uniref:Uncharacterized protein n=1 Tax=Candida tenuis (strain ATCC 10573 / BCRC 21748 / CBS 615 / JCM 9827 / NBRC 10315 / NRRL Y-1498 / VKM Y-70) TaxID=590646 RepID=G3BC87_CANTC|nr:uncharacterized protein CANTEDRAFT_116164 [Yamadazyma tenuis ATCC 10573]XP_006690243.1 uncharacterized protein CANTEDRAFT_116164 [Yamadazyma tenuis ATCC 10573]EGV61028.1 hypothetical protein CANTEDRAFT_116164 [Yamadazyma tenuis ATCC 10573]EGV61029.1 hypothetical protein CANTEDRAFT_116164 [Yamadazyma tenuis ATCC 10573]WEJ94619.1 hypothetical protein PSN45_002110 [Yamadazyma tenuis]